MNLMNLVPIVGITAGCLLTGYVFTKLVNLIKYWIDHRHSDSDEVEYLLQEFNDYKHSVERRLQNLETIISEENAPLIDMEEKPESSLGHDSEIVDSRFQNMLKKTR